MTPRFHQLPIPVPPMLEDSLGYQGHARWVAFYWTPYGDELCYHDGAREADGSWHAWLTFTRHPRIAPHLEPYQLGNSEEAARHWLLLDRESRVLSVGEAAAIESFLRQQLLNPPSPAPEHVDIPTLLQIFQQRVSRPVDPHTVQQMMEREDQLVQDLATWLDSQAQNPEQ